MRPLSTGLIVALFAVRQRRTFAFIRRRHVAVPNALTAP
jgi:hypothetical protein